MSNKLKSLKEHNQIIFNMRQSLEQSPKNGIACPNCGEELFDTDPTSILTSNPPQKSTHCKNCKYTGYRYI